MKSYQSTGKQVWMLCPWLWGIDEWVTIESSAGKLVLCDICEVVNEQHVIVEIREVPVKLKDMKAPILDL